MTNQIGIKQDLKLEYLPSSLNTINLTLIVQPYTIPSGTPERIKK
jgi:hypothetical protein